MNKKFKSKDSIIGIILGIFASLVASQIEKFATIEYSSLMDFLKSPIIFPLWSLLLLGFLIICTLYLNYSNTRMKEEEITRRLHELGNNPQGESTIQIAKRIISLVKQQGATMPDDIIDSLSESFDRENIEEVLSELVFHDVLEKYALSYLKLTKDHKKAFDKQFRLR